MFRSLRTPTNSFDFMFSSILLCCLYLFALSLIKYAAFQLNMYIRRRKQVLNGICRTFCSKCLASRSLGNPRTPAMEVKSHVVRTRIMDPVTLKKSALCMSSILRHYPRICTNWQSIVTGNLGTAGSRRDWNPNPIKYETGMLQLKNRIFWPNKTAGSWINF